MYQFVHRKIVLCMKYVITYSKDEHTSPSLLQTMIVTGVYATTIATQ
jgi:hypothetical protein